MDGIIRKFWWDAKAGKSQYLALCSWKEICKPKDLGGLGFRSFWDYNTALLAKLAWKIIRGEDSLWIELLKAKYLKEGNFFNSEKKSGDSRVWRSIISAKEVIQKGTCYRIGQGTDINIWSDPWVPGLGDKIPIRKAGANPSIIRVSDLLDPETTWWKESVVREIMEERSAEEVLKINGMFSTSRDTILWTGNSTGVFSMRSAHMVDKGYNCMEDTTGLWTALWKLKIHDRLKMFMWRVMSGCLPTKARLATFLKLDDMTCVLCGGAMETLTHLLCHCEAIKILTFGSRWGLKWDSLVSNDLNSLFEVCIKPGEVNFMGDSRETSLVLVLAMYTIWKLRNEVTFQGGKDIKVAISQFEKAVEEFSRIPEVATQQLSKKEVFPKIPTNCVIVNSDFASGITSSTIAMTIRDGDGRIVFWLRKICREWTLVWVN